MINNPPPFKGHNISIPILIPIKGRVFTHLGSGLLRCCFPCVGGSSLCQYSTKSRVSALGFGIRSGPHRSFGAGFAPDICLVPSYVFRDGTKQK